MEEKKNDNDLSNTLSYKISYGIAWVIGRIAGILVRTLYAGIITASQEWTPLIFIYVCLAIVAILSCALIGNCIVVVVITIIVAVCAGIWVRNKQAPFRNRVKYFNEIFETLNFKSKDGLLPIFLYEEEISEYGTSYVFRTFIPLSEWLSKKEDFEMYFNAKIINILQDKEDNRQIAIAVEDKPIPEYIEWHDQYVNIEEDIFNIGVTHFGVIGVDLNKNPHILIAGETGSGKSNILKCFIYQSIIKEYETVLIDFKRGVSFAIFGELVKLYYDYDTAQQVLEEMVAETKRRLDLFREAKVEDIISYNKLKVQKLKRIVIFIDELAELLKVRDKEISNSLYDSIETLTRTSRAAGINLIMGIQRPDSTVISGQIKSNVSYRICGHFTDKEPSRIMLGNDKASTLANIRGRCVIKSSDYYEVQSFYFYDNGKKQQEKEEEIEREKQNENISSKDVLITSNEIDFDFSDINNS